MAKGTALVKSRERYKKLISVFPDRVEFYNEKLAEIEQELHALQVCRRCGRPLKDRAARERGYGDECLAKTEAESK